MLLTLHNAGKTARQIVEALGGGLTRNAVLGKLDRLGLSSPMTKSQSIRIGKQTQHFHSRGTPRGPDKPLPVFKPAPEEPPPALDRQGAPYTLLTIPFCGHCKFPKGDPDAENFHLCGQTVAKPGKAYCEFHDRRAHIPRAAA